jgi:hypothetical protein
MSGGAPVARHDDVSELAQMEICQIFAAPSGLDVPGLTRLTAQGLCRPIEHIAQRAREPHISHRGSLRIRALASGDAAHIATENAGRIRPAYPRDKQIL